MVLENRKKRELHHGARRDHGKALVRLTLFLVVLGLAIVYSASSHVSEGLAGDSTFFLHRQAEKAAVGVALMFLFSKIDYRKLSSLSKPLLLISTGLLLLLLLLPESSSILGGPRNVGDDSERIRRWYSLFGTSIQPSEFAKLVVILWGAYTAQNKMNSIESFWRGVFPFLLTMAGVSILVALEPDLSQAALISVSLFIILYLAGSRKAHMIPIVLSGMVFFVIFCRLEPYRWKRLLGFLGLSGMTHSVNYQGNQSLIAIGSGGVIGVGFGAGKQKLLFLPEMYKDFIFASVGEEFGLLGAVLLIVAYCMFAYYGFKIARAAKDRFGYYLSSGLVVMIILGAIIHIMVVEVMLPSTGLTLPFISYGGSSLVASLIAVGILRSVARVASGKTPSKAVE